MPDFHKPEEISLNGVYYSRLTHLSEEWRVGSIVADWQSRLALVSPRPEKEDLDKLAKEGIFPAVEKKASPLVVMCAGLGAAWPGMGRELYDNFPAAREAMDEIASLSEWDVLGLMDEKDPELINSSRFQIPYLFLLEYAQWCQLRWLGLKPDLVCGHSLGELVALCLAGVYPVEAAWLLLDTRARHMEELERMGNGETGMLAVSAEREKIEEILEKWPGLAISNANTPRQYVLGGPRPELLEARRALRRGHIPAFMLPINLAFHNPAMRILRDLSTRRLNTLEMHAPQIPLLSCVTKDLYPTTQKEISRQIADLDENTVDWIGSVQSLRDKWRVSTFLELGPQDILCGLTRENDPEAKCIAADAKNHERQAMRSACAQLFACGYLPWRHLKSLRETHLPKTERHPGDSGGTAHVSGWTGFGNIPEHELKELLTLISETGNCPTEKLEPGLDLKYDLGFGSSNFPRLVQEAETRLGKNLEIEKIFNISTLGDLVLFLAGQDPRSASATNQPATYLSRHPGYILDAYCWQPEQGFSPVKINPERSGLLKEKSGPILLIAENAETLDTLWQGIAPLQPKLLLSENLAENCPLLRKAGAKIIHLDLPAGIPDAETLRKSAFFEEKRKIAGIFAALPETEFNHQNIKILESRLEKLAGLKRSLPENAWIVIFQKFLQNDGNIAETEAKETAAMFFRLTGQILDGKGIVQTICMIARSEKMIPRLRNAESDLFALAMLYGKCACQLWTDLEKPDHDHSIFCDNPDAFFFQCEDEKRPRTGAWEATGQYSCFAWPELKQHGEGEEPWCAKIEKVDDSKAAWLPIGEVARRVLEAGNCPLPWLEPISLQDFHLISLPELPQGVTRECRATVLKRSWLIQNNSYARLCKIRMAFQNILPNGRRTNAWTDLANGIGAYSRGQTGPELIWPISQGGEKLPEKLLENFYNKMNFGPFWRILSDAEIANQEKHIMSFNLTYQAGEATRRLAQEEDWGYNIFSILVEGISQASFFATDYYLTNPDKYSAYKFAGIGYLHFDWTSLASNEPLRLELRLAWQNAAMLRYDAQILDSSGKPALVMTQLELETQIPQPA